MKRSPVLPVLIALILCPGSPLVGQTRATGEKSDNPPPQMGAADRTWVELQARLTPPAPGGKATAGDAATRALARREQAARFLQAADEARAFVEKNPGHAKTPEARRLEAKNLLQAAMAGDNSREGEAATVLQTVRGDATLPAKARLEVVALADIVRLRPLARDRVKFLAAHEKSAHGLIAEFPGEPAAYEGLLRLAESHPEDAEAIRIAGDILKMPAPDGVKTAARQLLDRQALVGKSLPALADAALGKSNLISAAEGKGTILYTWASWSPGSIAAAKNLAKNASAGVRLVGINLDQDTAAAQALAKSEGLAGEQLYDGRGLESPLAQALKLGRVGEVYVASRQGELRSVSAQRGDLTAKLGAADR